MRYARAPLNLEVGKTYLDRAGNPHRIVEERYGEFWDEIGRAYRSDGTLVYGQMGRDDDLRLMGVAQ